ncbi:MAG: hypothetical protein HQK50_19030 [Oligoflexia bacterium]|nr:hypothetical protein [Oligoflexia bacterium]MBF0367672.1 hypothetical protein [Oligoflexia bacterium]
MRSSTKSSHDLNCFSCGSENDDGLKLNFHQRENGEVFVIFYPNKKYQSYENILHGGIQSLLLDAVMVQAIKRCGDEAVTGKMEFKFLKQVSINQIIEVTATINEKRGDFYIVSSWIKQKREIKTKSSGIYKKRSRT